MTMTQFTLRIATLTLLRTSKTTLTRFRVTRTVLVSVSERCSAKHWLETSAST